MYYLFVLGREPLLSTAEILSVLNKKNTPHALKAWEASFCVIETKTSIDYKNLMQELGGTIKIAEVFSVLNDYRAEKNLEVALEKNILDFLEKKGGLERKVFFGLSVYNQEKVRIKNKNLGLQIKKKLGEAGVKSRFVTSHEETLSAVTVKMNKLLSERGAEIILAATSTQLFFVATLTVQPFEEFSERDYGRPGRDSRSGMLPPKLAKIMINLASQKNEVAILDPFCGSGTVLTEAYLMNYRKLYGSDNSPKAITDTEKNLAWSQAQAQIKICDATKLSTCYKPNFFDAIITEPYLGPPFSGKERPEQILQTVSNLEELYLASLKEMLKIIKNAGIIIMVWPIIQNQKLKLEKTLPALGLELSSLLPKTEWYEEHKTLIYARKDQVVKREIVKIKKIAS